MMEIDYIWTVFTILAVVGAWVLVRVMCKPHQSYKNRVSFPNYSEWLKQPPIWRIIREEYADGRVYYDIEQKDIFGSWERPVILYRHDTIEAATLIIQRSIDGHKRMQKVSSEVVLTTEIPNKENQK